MYLKCLVKFLTQSMHSKSRRILSSCDCGNNSNIIIIISEPVEESKSAKIQKNKMQFFSFLQYIILFWLSSFS